MRIYFPLDEADAECLIEGSLEVDVFGADLLEYEQQGVYEDAVWVVVDVPEVLAADHEDEGSGLLGFREFTLPAKHLLRYDPRRMSRVEVEAILRRRMALRVEKLVASFDGRNVSVSSPEVRAFLDSEDLGNAVLAIASALLAERTEISADELLEIRDLARELLVKDRYPPNLVELVPHE